MSTHKANWVLLALLSLILVACAPGAAGSSPSLAISAPIGETLVLTTGSEIYLRRAIPLGDLGLKVADLSGMFWVPAGVNKESANIIDRFDFEADDLPPGWRLEMSRLRIEREVETRHGEDTGRVFVDAVPVFHLIVPANARLGVQSVGGVIRSSGGEEFPIDFALRIRAN